jgi:DNA-binding MarR family transcriptional regulator
MPAEARPELARLFEEVVRFYLSLSHTAALMYRHGQLSGPRRTLLVMLSRTGPLTVAHIARARRESRQRVQPLVNALVRAGGLAYVPNPAHRRSPLVTLTPKGQKTVHYISELESTLRARLTLDVPARALTAAADVLRQVREALEHPETLQAIAEERKVKR